MMAGITCWWCLRYVNSKDVIKMPVFGDSLRKERIVSKFCSIARKYVKPEDTPCSDINYRNDFKCPRMFHDVNLEMCQAKQRLHDKNKVFNTECDTCPTKKIVTLVRKERGLIFLRERKEREAVVEKMDDVEIRRS
jgi:hypothetical protein